MTKVQAQLLMVDLAKGLSAKDYVENVYISIKDVGTKIFRNCAYYEAEGYAFIWTKEENFVFNKKEIGDFVIVPYTHESLLSKKVT